MGLLELLYRKQHSFRQRLTAQRYRLVRAMERKGTTPVELEVSDPRKVLLILTGLIGDSVMATPVIAEARKLWPRAEITLLGTPNSVALFEACPELDALRVAGVDAFSLRGWNRIAQLKQWLAVCHFDVAIIILGDQFAALLATAQIPVRVGVRGSLLESCLTHRYEIESARTWGPSERLNALRCLGFQVLDAPPSPIGFSACPHLLGTETRRRRLGAGGALFRDPPIRERKEEVVEARVGCRARPSSNRGDRGALPSCRRPGNEPRGSPYRRRQPR